MTFISPFALDFLTRVALDLLALWALVRLVYFRRHKHVDPLFTFVACNVVIFLIAFLMGRVELTMGAAFGMFAVFSMLRYRTEGISAIDMTYLFLSIGLGLLMAVGTLPVPGLAAVAAGLILTATVLEHGVLGKPQSSQHIRYDRVDLVDPSRRDELIADLRKRTGLAVTRVHIWDVDLVQDSVHLTAYYDS
ncbi:MAG: DUF4956 domain-containing protein [Gemmatimonadetes bacterium]|nr:DUF4956 domain-containing protein [Gemmatimonadota bacterium]